MIGLLCFVLAILALPFKSKLRLQAENAVLRHQLIVLRRRLHGRVRLTNHDRWFFIQLYPWFPGHPEGSHSLENSITLDQRNRRSEDPFSGPAIAGYAGWSAARSTPPAGA